MTTTGGDMKGDDEGEGREVGRPDDGDDDERTEPSDEIRSNGTALAETSNVARDDSSLVGGGGGGEATSSLSSAAKADATTARSKAVAEAVAEVAPAADDAANDDDEGDNSGARIHNIEAVASGSDSSAMNNNSTAQTNGNGHHLPTPPHPHSQQPHLVRTESNHLLSSAVYVKDDLFGWRPAELLSQPHHAHAHTAQHATGADGEEADEGHAATQDEGGAATQVEKGSATGGQHGSSSSSSGSGGSKEKKEGGGGGGGAHKKKDEGDVAWVTLSSHPALDYTRAYYKHGAGRGRMRRKAGGGGGGGGAGNKPKYGRSQSSSFALLNAAKEQAPHNRSGAVLLPGGGAVGPTSTSAAEGNGNVANLQKKKGNNASDPADDDKEHSADDEDTLLVNLPQSTPPSSQPRTPPLRIDLAPYDSRTLPLQDVDESGELILREDLSDVPYLHEASILYLLAERHAVERPYTRAGVVIVSVNPLRWIDALYSVQVRREYARRYVWDDVERAVHPSSLRAFEGSDRRLPPHVYEASSQAYRGLVSGNGDQSILVSGESGAGKTETVKILLAHLASFDWTRAASGGSSKRGKGGLLGGRSLSLGDLAEEEGKDGVEGTGTGAEMRRKKKSSKPTRSRPPFRLTKMISQRLFSQQDATGRRQEVGPKEPLPPMPDTPIKSTHPTLCRSPSSVRYLGGPNGGDDTDDGSLVLNEADRDDEEKARAIVSRVIDTNPLLEAFGNAKTVMNDNSSRFGKYTKLQFDVSSGGSGVGASPGSSSCTLAGSTCQTFLLEKSRVVHHDSDRSERTFHIFYQLLSATDEKKENIWSGLKGTDASSFKYVGVPSTNVVEGMTDAERFDEVCDVLESIGIKDDSLVSLFQAVCVVLQLGNLTFDVDPDNEEGSIVASQDELERLSEVLGVPPGDIAACLTFRTMTVAASASSSSSATAGRSGDGPDVYKVPLNVDAASDARDALAKEVYAATFRWLVRAINDATCAEKNYRRKEAGAATSSSAAATGNGFGAVGLLDLFGFENYVEGGNFFEQLCVNHANERLQRKFTGDVFHNVQEEYESEGIDLEEVTIEDNSSIIGLIEGRLGLLDLLNEECLRPRGNDEAFVNKLYSNNMSNPALYTERLFQRHEFGIRHYAGAVKYDAANIVHKNRDALPPDAVACAALSANPIIFLEFQPLAKELEGKKGTLVHRSVWSKFSTDLASLMKDIGRTTTRYVRCIVPNRDKRPLVTDLRFALLQLRYAGILSAVSISRASFPNRMEINKVIERFTFLRSADSKIARRKSSVTEAAPQDGSSDGLSTRRFSLVRRASQKVVQNAAAKSPDELRLEASELLEALLYDIDLGDSKQRSHFVCGKTQVYFRARVIEFLEAKRLLAYGLMATKIQCMVRCRVARKRLEELMDERVRNAIVKEVKKEKRRRELKPNIKKAFKRVRRKLAIVGLFTRQRRRKSMLESGNRV